MAAVFDSLCDVVPGKDSWRFSVRVARLWSVFSFRSATQVNSIEMVLVDDKGGKIHATIRRQLLYLFQRKISEGGVYNVSNFNVIPSTGSYRATLHPYRLLFQMKTKVEPSVNPAIPRFGLSLSTIDELCSHSADYAFLVDVIGLLTGVSSEREYLKDSKVTKMIVLEITDHTGKCECALFGDYVDQFREMFGNVSDAMPVVVVQYAKVKIFRDKTSLQNVMNTTRIFINPDIDAAVSFRKSLPIHGLEADQPVPVLSSRVKPSLEDDFLRIYPAKTIDDLQEIVDNGTFIVAATIGGMVEGEDWWYPSCKCHKSVTIDSGAYYCDRCARHVFHMIPRFRVKVHVTDGTGEAIFVLFDSDVHYLVGEDCAGLVTSSKVENAGDYPSQLLALEGTKVLFKVEKTSSLVVSLDGSFKVKRVCTDSDILESFDHKGSDPADSQGSGKTSLVPLDTLSQTSSEAVGVDMDSFVSGLLVSPGELYSL